MPVKISRLQILKQVLVNAKTQTPRRKNNTVVTKIVYLAIHKLHRFVLLISTALIHTITAQTTRVNTCRQAPAMIPTIANIPTAPNATSRAYEIAIIS
jgi:c-di-GMP-related signal transduction protein